MATKPKPKRIIPLTPARKPYSQHPEQWPDRMTTDHRELGYGQREDSSLAWLLIAGLIILAVLIV